VIDIRHVRKSFNGNIVLRDVNLKIDEGKTWVIIGCSGCGKTVLLKSIIGLIKPDSGEIVVDGEEITQMDRRNLFRIRKKFGMLFQGAALFDSMTVEENIGLALWEHTDLSPEDIRRKVKEMLKVVGLGDMEDKKPAELSGGMKKRVGLARALIMDPEIVLFDEPTTGLDPILADTIHELILETNRRFNITSIVVTHDMATVLKIGDRVAMLSNGQIVFEGTPSKLEVSRNEDVRQFVTGRA